MISIKILDRRRPLLQSFVSAAGGALASQKIRALWRQRLSPADTGTATRLPQSLPALELLLHSYLDIRSGWEHAFEEFYHSCSGPSRRAGQAGRDDTKTSPAAARHLPSRAHSSSITTWISLASRILDVAKYCNALSQYSKAQEGNIKNCKCVRYTIS